MAVGPVECISDCKTLGLAEFYSLLKTRKGRREREGRRERGTTYFANALASAFRHDTFCAPTKESTVTAMARSTSCEVQYSLRRILQKASEMRMMASRWRTLLIPDVSKVKTSKADQVTQTKAGVKTTNDDQKGGKTGQDIQ